MRGRCKNHHGFTLIELVVVVMILGILAAIAAPRLLGASHQATDNGARQSLGVVRNAIDQYTTDKGKLPKSIDDLVEAKYLRERPVDPTLQSTDWEEVQGPDPNSAEGEEGLVDVKSTNTGQDSEGKPYNEY